MAVPPPFIGLPRDIGVRPKVRISLPQTRAVTLLIPTYRKVSVWRRVVNRMGWKGKRRSSPAATSGTGQGRKRAGDGY